MYIGYSVYIDVVKDRVDQVLTIQNSIEDLYESIDKRFENNLKIYNISSLNNPYCSDHHEIKNIIMRFSPEVMHNHKNSELQPIVIEANGVNPNEKVQNEMVEIWLEINENIPLNEACERIQTESGLSFVSIGDKKQKTIRLEFPCTEISSYGVTKIIQVLSRISIDSFVSNTSFSSSAMRELFRSRLTYGMHLDQIRTSNPDLL